MLTIRMVVHVVGGVVQEIVSPDDVNSVSVILADYDNEDLDSFPVHYYPVQEISESEYEEYLNDVGRTGEQIYGLTTE